MKNKGPNINLDDIHETSGTASGDEKALDLKSTDGGRTTEWVTIPAPPKKGDGGFDWGPVLKGLGWVATIISVSGAIIGATWYFASLSTNVDVLKSDMKDVSTKTDNLIVTSIKQGDKLDVLEDSINNVDKELTNIDEELKTQRELLIRLEPTSK